jgi:hypothetical protein
MSIKELPQLKRGGAGIYACVLDPHYMGGFSRCAGNALILLPKESDRS